MSPSPGITDPCLYTSNVLPTTSKTRILQADLFVPRNKKVNYAKKPNLWGEHALHSSALISETFDTILHLKRKTIHARNST
jgi:hypothetical protein